MTVFFVMDIDASVVKHTKNFMAFNSLRSEIASGFYFHKRMMRQDNNDKHLQMNCVTNAIKSAQHAICIFSLK